MQCGMQIVSEWVFLDFAYLTFLYARLLKILIYCRKANHAIDTVQRAMNYFL
jgi:hypothetical protein